MCEKVRLSILKEGQFFWLSTMTCMKQFLNYFDSSEQNFTYNEEILAGAVHRNIGQREASFKAEDSILAFAS